MDSIDKQAKQRQIEEFNQLFDYFYNYQNDIELHQQLNWNSAQFELLFNSSQPSLIRRPKRQCLERKPRQAYNAKQLERLEAEFQVSFI